jgi:transposase
MFEFLLQRIENLERASALQATLIAMRDREILELRAALAERDAMLAERDAEIKELKEYIAKLEAQLNTNSSNSSKPPSSDPPWKQKPSKGNTNGKRGAQKGHRGIARELVPVEEVDVVVSCKPVDLCACGGTVTVEDSDPERKQVFEIPHIKPHITEYQVFGGSCSCCAAKLRGILPADAPSGMLGPNAQATIALLTGKYHLSKRDVQELFSDYFGLSICVGTVCNAERQVSAALKKPYEEVVFAIKEEAVVAADETGHKIAGKRGWMWLALSSFYAVFFARASRSKKVAQEILGTGFSGILISDRYNGYLWVSRRQLCWAHLIRDLNKLADAGGLAAQFACPVLIYVQKMFSVWHRFRENEINRAQLQTEMQPIRINIEKCLELGLTVPLADVLCKSLCRLKTALWAFIDNEGVEPTNNDAERTVRQYVIWRKTSFGTQGEKGNQFVERILTAVGTCKRQNRGFFDYLSQLMTARLLGLPVPSLLQNTAL